jgi:predicted dehydrogenase
MASKHKVCIVGGGNISNTRHIPALNKTGRVEIVGLIGKSKKDVDRTISRWKIHNNHLFESVEKLRDVQWLKDVDLAIVGVPPQDHFIVVKAFLSLGKNVLVEKPFTMTPEEGEILINLAKQKGVRLFVMHNFQFTSAYKKLEKLKNQGKLGIIDSYFEFQLTNDTRRLPSWYNELPLGLFFDEAAHFLYLLERLEGNVELVSGQAFSRQDPKEKTPVAMSVNLRAGEVPVNMYINFNSPVCEWYLIALGTKQIAIFDFFRDILITIPNDGLHLAKDVISNSIHFTYGHWLGTIVNGLKMITGNLLYGHDKVMNLVLDSIDNKSNAMEIDGLRGLANITVINNITNTILDLNN